MENRPFAGARSLSAFLAVDENKAKVPSDKLTGSSGWFAWSEGKRKGIEVKGEKREKERERNAHECDRGGQEGKGPKGEE